MDITVTDYADVDMPEKMLKQQWNLELINFDTCSSAKYRDSQQRTGKINRSESIQPLLSHP